MRCSPCRTTDGEERNWWVVNERGNTAEELVAARIGPYRKIKVKSFSLFSHVTLFLSSLYLFAPTKHKEGGKMILFIIRINHYFSNSVNVARHTGWWMLRIRCSWRRGRYALRNFSVSDEEWRIELALWEEGWCRGRVLYASYVVFSLAGAGLRLYDRTIQWRSTPTSMVRTATPFSEDEL